jgi:hypothetical protein
MPQNKEDKPKNSEKIAQKTHTALHDEEKG